MTIMILLGAGVGLGVLLLTRGLVPAKPDLAVEVGRWEAARRQAAQVSEQPDDRRGLRLRIGRWLADQLSRAGLEPPSLRQDLAILDRRIEDFVLKTVAVFLVGLFIPNLILGLVAAAGLSVGVVIPASLGVGLAFGVGLAVLNFVDLHSDANERRKEMRRALSVYLTVVRMGLGSGRGLPEALPMAAEIGAGWTFEMLEATLRRARNRGVPESVGWDELGERIGVGELRDLGSSVELVGEEGARVQESLAARADTLRQRERAEAKAVAKAKNSSMGIAAIVLVLGEIAFIGFPTLMSVLAA